MSDSKGQISQDDELAFDAEVGGYIYDFLTSTNATKTNATIGRNGAERLRQYLLARNIKFSEEQYQQVCAVLVKKQFFKKLPVDKLSRTEFAALVLSDLNYPVQEQKVRKRDIILSIVSEIVF